MLCGKVYITKKKESTPVCIDGVWLDLMKFNCPSTALSGNPASDVGSSNLSNAAISSGLEWNVKVTRKDLPETIDKIAATFESYWNTAEFEYYSEGQRERLAHALKAEKYFDRNGAELYTMDVTPYAYQQEILDKLEAERTVRGYTRNLIVAATEARHIISAGRKTA